MIRRTAASVAVLVYLSIKIDPVWGQGIPLIKKLTSKKAAEKVEKEIAPQGAKPRRRPESGGIPKELKIHSLGVGLGQTFIRGDLGDHGVDGITADIFL